MKLNSFLKEHGLKIEDIGTDEDPMYVLIRESDKKRISPENSMRDFIIHWIKSNTNEIYFKLYNEED